MSAKQVTGILVPDATVISTGEPAGTHAGQPYWEYVGGDGQTWKLHKSIGVGWWFINLQFIDDFNWFSNPAAPGWYRNTSTVDGIYVPFQFVTGDATVGDAPEPSFVPAWGVQQMRLLGTQH